VVTKLVPCAFVLCVLALAPVAAAQPDPPQPPVAGAPTDDMSPGQVHQLFDAMLVMQAQDALALSEGQYAQFVSRLKTLQDARRRNQQTRVRMIGELQRLTNPRNPKPADESEITRRLSALQELEARTAADVRRAYGGIDEVLSPLQRARFRVLEEQIERRKLELIGRARQNNQQRPNSQRPPMRRR
jgi:lipase chaperone LimK